MKIPILPCKYHQNGGFSMAMLVSGRVVLQYMIWFAYHVFLSKIKIHHRKNNKNTSAHYWKFMFRNCRFKHTTSTSFSDSSSLSAFIAWAKVAEGPRYTLRIHATHHDLRIPGNPVIQVATQTMHQQKLTTKRESRWKVAVYCSNYM